MTHERRSTGTFVPRILVVAEDPMLRELLTKLVTQEGYPHVASGSSLGALTHLDRGEVDIVLLDNDVEASGMPLLERISRRFPAVHTIAFVATATEAADGDAIRMGASAALVKPVTDLELVKRALRRARDMIRLGHRRSRALEEKHAEEAALGQLDRSAKELLSELLTLYAGARAQGISIDLRSVQALAGAATSQLFAGRTALFLSYDVRDRCLRAERPAGARRLPSVLEIPVTAELLPRLRDVDHMDPFADRLRSELGNEDLLLAPVGYRQDTSGVLVVMGSRDRPFLPGETGLLKRFTEWLSLCFEGANLYKEVLDLSAIDGLTGLYNHRFFHDRLRDEVARATRYDRSVSLLFCDIDDFKLYNDRNGHAAGDGVLKALGQILRNTGEGGAAIIAFRESDVRARYGGEEFAVILPETAFESAVGKAERLREAVAQTNFPRAENQPHGRLTVSIGISEYPRHAEDKNQLLESADQAMYRAKQLGKNRVMAAT